MKKKQTVIIEIMSNRVPDADKQPTTPRFIEKILNIMDKALAGRGINGIETNNITRTAIKTLATTFFSVISC
jgi:hypothetical protein